MAATRGGGRDLSSSSLASTNSPGMGWGERQGLATTNFTRSRVVTLIFQSDFMLSPLANPWVIFGPQKFSCREA